MFHCFSMSSIHVIFVQWTFFSALKATKQLIGRPASPCSAKLKGVTSVTDFHLFADPTADALVLFLFDSCETTCDLILSSIIYCKYIICFGHMYSMSSVCLLAQQLAVPPQQRGDSPALRWYTEPQRPGERREIFDPKTLGSYTWAKVKDGISKSSGVNSWTGGSQPDAKQNGTGDQLNSTSNLVLLLAMLGIGITGANPRVNGTIRIASLPFTMSTCQVSESFFSEGSGCPTADSRIETHWNPHIKRFKSS